MKSVTHIESFDGYPNGKKRSFVAGVTEELADTYADLLVGKGHSRYAPAEPPAQHKTATKGAGSAPNEGKPDEDE